jgi:uncharacterized membrane protein YeiB
MQTTTVWSCALSGGILIAYGIIGLFFLRSWKMTRDRLFATFATAFWILMLERMLILIVSEAHEVRPYVYVVRLFAFILIAAAIIDKNLKRGSS